MKALSRLVIDYAICQGACAAGIATLETLAGGPPSADLTAVLPEATSAVTFAFPLNQKLIPPFLAKKDRRAHEKDNIDTNALAGGLSLQLAKWLDQKGYPSLPQAPNDVYRQDTPGGALDMLPEIFHRYPDKKERQERYKMLKQSGAVIQHPDGRLEAVTPEAAESYLQQMPEETRSIYVDNS